MGKRVHHLREVSEAEVAETANTFKFTHTTLSDGAACEVDCQHA